jgi:hypothetical protein
VCGFHQGKPHEVRQRQPTQQEIRGKASSHWIFPQEKSNLAAAGPDVRMRILL